MATGNENVPQDDGDDNLQAGKLEAMWFLVFQAKTEEQLEKAKKLAAEIANMSDDEVAALLAREPKADEDEESKQEGDLVQHLRS